MDWPRFTVVVPCFNHAQFVGDTLESVVSQNYPNLELIVMDGGSTDGSVDVIKRFEPYLTHFHSGPDDGQTDALAKGFALSTGELQCWLNSDDMHSPTTLFEVAQWFFDHPKMDVVYGNTCWLDLSGKCIKVQKEIPFSRFLWIYTYNYIPCMSTFWRREIYDHVGGLDIDFNLAMDADLFFRMAEAGRIGHARRIWSSMYSYPEQKNKRLRAESDEEDLKIRLRYWPSFPPPGYRWKRPLAKLLRFAWKLGWGCYGPRHFIWGGGR